MLQQAMMKYKGLHTDSNGENQTNAGMLFSTALEKLCPKRPCVVMVFSRHHREINKNDLINP
uniref:Uncharacterized protein n=1 Tax=Romanomermis culicivorax TaxID=13658 RepID=A0A915HP23_ROMCU